MQAPNLYKPARNTPALLKNLYRAAPSYPTIHHLYYHTLPILPCSITLRCSLFLQYFPTLDLFFHHVYEYTNHNCTSNRALPDPDMAGKAEWG